MQKEQFISELNYIILELEDLISDETLGLIKGNIGEAQYLLSKTYSFVDKITGINKHHLKEVSQCIQASKRNGGIAVQNIQQLIGQLKFIKDGLSKRWIVKLQYEIVGNEMLEFLNHSIDFVADGRKIESSIISTAIFEDTIRKIGKKHFVENKNLEQVLNGLKGKGIFPKVFVQKMKYYAAVRNKALHASWSEFELDDVEQLNSDLENLINKYLIEK